MVLMTQHLNSVYICSNSKGVEEEKNRTRYVLANVRHQVALLSQSDSCHFLPIPLCRIVESRDHPILPRSSRNTKKLKHLSTMSSGAASMPACSATVSLDVVQMLCGVLLLANRGHLTYASYQMTEKRLNRVVKPCWFMPFCPDPETTLRKKRDTPRR